MAEQPQPFAVLPSSYPPITVPTAVPSPTSYIYTLPTIRSYSHIAVFLLPGITLPPNTAAAVYISLPRPGQTEPDFKFLGGIGPGKESAVLKISGLVESSPGVGGNRTMPEVTIGISIERAEEVGAKMTALPSSTNNATPNSTAQALVLANGGSGQGVNKEQTVKLAQKIIKNAFNFLASFSGNTANGIEVVPLKAFEGWWKRFEGKIVNDPGFLSREED